MSSLIGRDDLKAKLYSSGVRDPRKMSEVLRVIDIYSLQTARRAQDYEEVPPPPVRVPAFTPLKPGEWSNALQVTCCAKCTRVRRWEEYHLDKHHVTGHKILCKDCRRIPPGGDILPVKAEEVRRGGWLCRECGVRKTPLEFPLEKRVNPRKSVRCLSCKA